jgi:hypothetical protein
MLRVVTLILLCQAGMNHSAAAMDIPDLQDYSQTAQAAYQERELMQRYNQLARALNNFVEAYKAGQIDVKKAKAVRKALHDLEKLEWFKPWHSAAGAPTKCRELRACTTKVRAGWNHDQELLFGGLGRWRRNLPEKSCATICAFRNAIALGKV